jgi:hypothetical protein
MRGRKIMGGLVPYGKEWRTGANPATTLITPVDLMIGDLKVPAGTYTLFTLPSEGAGSSSSARRPASGASPTRRASTSAARP